LSGPKKNRLRLAEGGGEVTENNRFITNQETLTLGRRRGGEVVGMIWFSAYHSGKGRKKGEALSNALSGRYDEGEGKFWC